MVLHTTSLKVGVWQALYLFYLRYQSWCQKIFKSCTRGGSRTAATSKVELFVIIVNGWKPLTIIKKSSTLHVAAVLDPPLCTKYEDHELCCENGRPMKMRSALISTRAIARGLSHNAQKMKKSFMENVIFLCSFFMYFDTVCHLS